jgi:uncharacterized protein YjbI with pentapeptide repeats
LYDGLLVDRAKISNTRFNNTHFKNSQLGRDSDYNNCEFVNCKFFGKYSTLGFSTRYTNCNFIDCDFVGVTLFEGSKFYKCNFSGVIKNAIIQDSRVGLFGAKTAVFNDCDLRDVTFNNLSLYGSIGFNRCILPDKGLRKFRNDKDSLIQRAYDICSRVTSQDKIESEVIFKKDLKSGQNPIILDDIFLSSFFTTSDSRNIFETIVQEFEIK